MKLFKILAAALAVGALVVGCQQPTATTNNNTNGGTFTVLAQVNGQVLDDLGQPISGATITYNAPQMPTSSAASARAITNVTTDSKGNFTVANLQTGSYSFTILPPTTTTAGVTTVNNAAYTFTCVVPTLAQLKTGTQTNLSNQNVVLSQTFTLPRLVGTISGTLLENASGSTALPVPLGTALTLTLPTSNDSKQSFAGIFGTGVTYEQPLFATYNTTTNSVTTSMYETYTTADATGAFSFKNLPVGTSVNYNGVNVLADIGKGSQITQNSVLNGLALATLNAATYIGSYGSTPSLTLTNPVNLGDFVSAPLAFLSSSTTDQYGNTANVPATTTSITLTFNNTLSTQIPTINTLYDLSGAPVLAMLKNAAGQLVSATVTVSGKTLTLSNVALNPGTTYTVTYNLGDGITSTATNPLFGTVSFTTAGVSKLTLVGNSTIDAYGNTNTVSVSAPIVLTFSNTLMTTLPVSGAPTDAAGNPQFAVLTNTSVFPNTKVPATVTLSKNTLTLTPSASLSYGTNYTLNYAVYDGVNNSASSPLTGSVSFTTVLNPNAPVAVTNLAVDTTQANKGLYNGGATLFYVTYTYNQLYTYKAYYAVTANGVQGAWTQAGLSNSLSTNQAGVTTASGTITIPAASWVSGNTVSLELVESITANGSLTSTSNVLAITDQVAPTSYTYSDAVNANASYVATTVPVSLAGGNNTAGTSAKTITFQIGAGTVGANEVIADPTVTFGTTTTATVSSALTSFTTYNNISYPTGATVTITIPAGTSIAGNTAVITLKDAAVNQFTPTGATTPSTITLNITN